jgi:hypothetical protein
MHHQLFAVPLNRLALTHSSKKKIKKTKKKHYFYMRKFQQNYIKTSSKIRNSLSPLLQTHTHTHTNTHTQSMTFFCDFSLWLFFFSFACLSTSLRELNQITTTHIPPFPPFFFLIVSNPPPFSIARDVESYRAIQEHTSETEEDNFLNKINWKWNTTKWREIERKWKVVIFFFKVG